MAEEKLQITYGQVPKVLLIGNGINRAYGFASWDGLLESIRTKDFSEPEKECLKTVPYPLQPIILTGDALDTQMKDMAVRLAELRSSAEGEELLREYATLPVDGILTTNYTYELEKALNDRFNCMPSRRCRERKSIYQETSQYSIEQLHTGFFVEDYPPIWHIHGEAARYRTMILGHYQYGKLLSKMQQYVSRLVARFKATEAIEQGMEMRSWLDYFMVGDVYIVGLGMVLSELDLWWLINCKKRHFPDRKVILYKPDIKPEEKLLAEAYGVQLETGGFTGDYCAYYRWLHHTLQQAMEKPSTNHREMIKEEA